MPNSLTRQSEICMTPIKSKDSPYRNDGQDQCDSGSSRRVLGSARAGPQVFIRAWSGNDSDPCCLNFCKMAFILSGRRVNCVMPWVRRWWSPAHRLGCCGGGWAGPSRYDIGLIVNHCPSVFTGYLRHAGTVGRSEVSRPTMCSSLQSFVALIRANCP